MNTISFESLKGKRILIGISGSIAAIKTPLLISSLIKAGAEVKCVLTASAARLVSPISISTISRNRCFQDQDQWDPIEARPLHICLAEWAEIFVIAPLTATSLSKWVHGSGEGLLASILLACERPVIVAAAMNSGMWSNIAVKENWTSLQRQPNVICLEPSQGLLACDRFGEGKMVEPEIIQLAIESSIISLEQKGKISSDLSNKRILVTAGPTIERIDTARSISNRSSGKMGLLLAHAAKFRGAKVDLVHGPISIPESFFGGLERHPVRSSKEMEDKIKYLQPLMNMVAMASAVADIKRKNGANPEKIDKKDLIKSFLSNWEYVPDILKRIVDRRAKDQIVLGFSALTGTDEEIRKKAEAKKSQKGCDYLFANPINREGQGFEEDFNGGWLLGPQGSVKSIKLQSKFAIAHQLLNEIIAC